MPSIGIRGERVPADLGGEGQSPREGPDVEVLLPDSHRAVPVDGRTAIVRAGSAVVAAHGDRYVLCASCAGDDRHPQWYLNLMAAGQARVRVGDVEQEVEVERVSEAERARLWPRLVANWPSYEMYQRRTMRELPVVALTPHR